MNDLTELRVNAAALSEYASANPAIDVPTRESMAVLVNALAVNEPRLLAEHARWTAAMAGARAGESGNAFAGLHAQLDTLPDAALRQRAQEFVAAAALASPGVLDADPPLHRNATEFLELLLQCEAGRAQALVTYAVGRGMTLAQVYNLVLEPALIEAGQRWEAALLSVGQEHYITEATLRVMDALKNLVPHTPERGRTFVALCVEDENHAVGLRMLCDQLSVNGWKTVYLGANVPVAECAPIFRDNPQSIAGISVTMAAHLFSAREAIETIRAMNPRVPIVVGGRPFRDGGDLWRKLGADAGPRDAGEAVATIERLADERFGPA